MRASINEGRGRHETLAAEKQAVERAIQVMHTHLHEVLTLEDWASAGDVSPSHFKRVLPGEQLLLGNNASPLVIGHGHITSNPVLILHLPRLTDQPLVMGCPCCESKSEQLFKKS